MQATVRTTAFGFDRIKLALVAAGILATSIVGTAAVTQMSDSSDRVATLSASSRDAAGQHLTSDTGYVQEAAQVALQQSTLATHMSITSDAAYAIEASQVATQQAMRTAHASLTTDEVYATEAGQVAEQSRTQAARLLLTSDEAYVIEVRQVAEQARHVDGSSAP